VRNHVVQLARDPAPLDRDRCLRLQVALAGELRGQLLELGGA